MQRGPQACRRVGVGIMSLLCSLGSVQTLLPSQHFDPPASPAPHTPPAEAWLSTLASVLGPALTTVIRQGRDQAYPRGQAIPESIRRTLAPFFSRAVLQKVRYSTKWQDATTGGSLYTLLLGTGAEAVTLVDVIVFRDEQLAADPVLWAHELTHVEQYDRLGIEAFSTQYLQQAWVLEHEAIANANKIKRQLSP